MTQKTALSVMNIADQIHEYLEREWPMFAGCTEPSVWLTGSRIWSHLYGMEPPKGSDLDVFVIRPRQNIFSQIAQMNAKRCPVHLDLMKALGSLTVRGGAHGPKIGTSLGGDRITTPHGDVDLWTSPFDDPKDQLMNYPAGSHGQARVAYCPANGELIVLRNPMAMTAPAPMPLQNIFGNPIQLPQIPKAQVMSTKDRWNGKCPKCGKGIYQGLFSTEHEGGACPG